MLQYRVMAKRTYAEMEKTILLKVKEGEATYSRLQRATGTNYDTIKDHVERFEKAGWVKVLTAKHPSNGRLSHKVRITKSGEEYAQKL